jgi:hypothetical protein
MAMPPSLRQNGVQVSGLVERRGYQQGRAEHTDGRKAADEGTPEQHDSDDGTNGPTLRACSAANDAHDAKNKAEEKQKDDHFGN